MKFAPYGDSGNGIAAAALHDDRRDIVIEPAARRRATIEARGHSELGAPSWGGKNPPACLCVCLFVCEATSQLVTWLSRHAVNSSQEIT